MGRVELHFHLLPGIDDGPPDLATSIELAREAVADGTRLVTCTPHARLADVAELPARVDELGSALGRARAGRSSVIAADARLPVDRGPALSAAVAGLGEHGMAPAEAERLVAAAPSALLEQGVAPARRLAA